MPVETAPRVTAQLAPVPGARLVPFLFVYGTLCPDCRGALGHRERSRLAAEGSVLGVAEVRGQLLDLGAYPGFIAGAGRVHGLLLLLRRPAVTLAWLDAYELATREVDAEYDRVMATVALRSRETRSAWLYRLRVRPANPIVLPRGIWPGRRLP